MYGVMARCDRCGKLEKDTRGESVLPLPGWFRVIHVMRGTPPGAEPFMLDYCSPACLDNISGSADGIR